ncbi:sterol glucosyltransferase [Ceratobasidium theobromae]|uniref:Sterol glucosyltransferase n=1 Tax=Ceratobasidium theobromae TaxID=1582974 RepID=A0A5N5QC75_9AGAM|nr:sterol glucosyltransferase [Ceratobasidium theobromae]
MATQLKSPTSVAVSSRGPDSSFDSLKSLTDAGIRAPTSPHWSSHEQPNLYSSRHGTTYYSMKPAPPFQSESSLSTLHTEKELPPIPSYSEIQAGTSFRGDGRLDVLFDHRLSNALPESYGAPVYEVGIDETGFLHAPRMNINIMIVGSRGDVQPYLALGQRLQQYGHNVRLSTHETFRKLVNDAGLRFYNIGGDPHELMSYMVRNPGLIPGFESLRNGDISKKRKMVAEILEGCFQSCFAPDKGSEEDSGFVADAIISNPPTFAHIHCAEALGIPLLLSFTMPWCPTAAFPHPLVNVKQSEDTEPKLVNYYSYGLVELMTWQGLGRTINKFRMKRLGLDYLSTASAVGMIERCAIPWTYCLSPALVPKPKDWMSHIDVVGFYFLDLASGYQPPDDLVRFLRAGPPPIYVGFGSIVLDNPEQVTMAVLSGIAQAGVRAIISPGWGGLDADMIKASGPHVFALGNVPHDWLFQYVSAVCHHGGAGTTAIGLKCGKPTIIVPFFGDQPWWAAQIARQGAGSPPLNPKKLTTEAMASAIRIALSPNTSKGARILGEMIKKEDGVRNGVESFHRHMPLLDMRCDLDPGRVASWYSPKLKMRMSAFAAQVLAEEGYIKLKKLKLYRSREYHPHVGPSDPITGAVPPAIKILNDFGRGVAKLPSEPVRGVAQMLSATTFGVQSTLKGASEGLYNVPKLYGSRVREHKEVKGLGSGLAQGTKSLVMGTYDGIHDLFAAPVQGYKENGMLGAVAGVGVGAMNATTKPLAGVLQFVSMPLEGTAKNMRSLAYKPFDKDRITARYAEGILATKCAGQREREVVITAFVERRGASKLKRKGKGKAV